jgi:hypothetical protein
MGVSEDAGPPSSSGPGFRPFKAATRVRIPLGAHNRILAGVEEPGRPHRPVKAEIAGSKPVTRAEARSVRAGRGQVAQLAEHAAENRGVGSSILPLATSDTEAALNAGRAVVPGSGCRRICSRRPDPRETNMRERLLEGEVLSP